MAEFVEVCSLGDIPPDRGRGVTVADLPIALFRDPDDPDQVIALHGRCPHANGPMGRAWVDEGEAICPLHRWRFDLRTGANAVAPARPCPTYPVAVVAGRVFVALPG